VQDLFCTCPNKIRGNKTKEVLLLSGIMKHYKSFLQKIGKIRRSMPEIIGH
jgi:hypothetical protein